jgi:hypothetical protein
MSIRLSVKDLHSAFVTDLDDRVTAFSEIGEKPIEVCLLPPMRPVRAYLFNLTKPPGGRSENEYKIQIILPGQARGSRGNFDFGNGDHFIMLGGYDSAFGVWVFWDAYIYHDFSYSRNVQVLASTLIAAAASGIGRQTRETKNGSETVIACSRRNLVLAVQLRQTTWAKDSVRRA